MLTHTGERRHHCGDCGKDFRRLEHLKLHMRTHSGEKPYKCELCGRGFAQLGDLKKHSWTHSGVRPFNCECGKSFTSKAAYQKHLESHKEDLVKKESVDPEHVALLETLPVSGMPLQMQVKGETIAENKGETIAENVDLPVDKVDNLVIDVSQIQNISINSSLDIQHVLSTLAQGELIENQPLTVVQTNPGTGSQVALRIVDKNVQIVSLSELTPEEAAASNVVQLETGSGLPQLSTQGFDYDNLLLQLQDAVATASSTAATSGDEVVHVLLEQLPVEQVEQDASRIQ
jgi:DNA-directed RNA polymerase subunit RPC12/RpoP